MQFTGAVPSEVEFYAGVQLPTPAKHIICRRRGGPLDTLQWEPLEDSARDECLQRLKWDIDFVGVVGKAEEIFGNEHVSELLANSSGRILKSCTLQAVRCGRFSQMLMFAKFGDYMFGLPVTGSDDILPWEDGAKENLESRNISRTKVNFAYLGTKIAY